MLNLHLHNPHYEISKLRLHVAQSCYESTLYSRLDSFVTYVILKACVLNELNYCTEMMTNESFNLQLCFDGTPFSDVQKFNDSGANQMTL